MKLDINLDRLDRVRRRVGADLLRIDLDTEILPDFQAVESQLFAGINVTIDDLDTTEGVFTYHGRQIVIYIKDHGLLQDVVSDPKAGNKVHMRDCRTIDNMKRKNRYNRYVATTRNDGSFLVDLGHGNDTDAKLLPCQNCLSDINYQGFRGQSYAGKQRILAEFDFEEMFEDYSVLFSRTPKYTDRTALPATYTKEWSSRSHSLRSRANWVCQECKVDCSPRELRKWLHVHHIDGVKSNNAVRNLKVLCVECHAREPNHGHMQTASAKARTVLRKRRRETT